MWDTENLSRNLQSEQLLSVSLSAETNPAPAGEMALAVPHFLLGLLLLVFVQEEFPALTTQYAGNPRTGFWVQLLPGDDSGRESGFDEKAPARAAA